MTTSSQPILRASWFPLSGIRFLLIYALLTGLTLWLFLNSWTWEFVLFHAIAIMRFINRATENICIENDTLIRKTTFPQFLTIIGLNTTHLKCKEIVSAHFEIIHERNYSWFRFPKYLQAVNP